MKDHLPILIPLSVWVGAWGLWVLSFLSYRLSRWAGYLVWAAAFSLAFQALSKVQEQGPWHYSLGGWPPPWGIEVVLTPLTLFLSFCVLAAGLLSYTSLGSFGLLAGLLKAGKAWRASFFSG